MTARKSRPVDTGASSVRPRRLRAVPVSLFGEECYVATGGQRSVGSLAAATATRPTTLTSVLDRLTRRGFVTRELDPADRRSFLVSLTAEGRRAAGAARAAAADLERAALAGISDADLAGFRAVTRALAEVQ